MTVLLPCANEFLSSFVIVDSLVAFESDKGRAELDSGLRSVKSELRLFATWRNPSTK